MMDHANVRLARSAWEAAAHGDADALSEVFAPDVVWHASGRGPRSGTIRGLEAVLEYLAALGDAADRFDSRFDQVLVGEGLVAVLFHVSGERRGRTLETDFILLFRIEGDQVVEVWAVPRDQHTIDEFWA